MCWKGRWKQTAVHPCFCHWPSSSSGACAVPSLSHFAAAAHHVQLRVAGSGPGAAAARCSGRRSRRTALEPGAGPWPRVCQNLGGQCGAAGALGSDAARDAAGRVGPHAAAGGAQPEAFHRQTYRCAAGVGLVSIDGVAQTGAGWFCCTAEHAGR